MTSPSISSLSFKASDSDLTSTCDAVAEGPTSMDPNAFQIKYPIETTTSPIDPYVSATVSASAVVATNRSTCSIPSVGIARVATFVVLVVAVVVTSIGIDRRVIIVIGLVVVVVVVVAAFAALVAFVFVVADARCVTGVVIIARVIILVSSVVAH